MVCLASIWLALVICRQYRQSLLICVSTSEKDNPGKGLVRAKLLCIRKETDKAKLPSTQVLILFLPGDL